MAAWKKPLTYVTPIIYISVTKNKLWALFSVSLVSRYCTKAAIAANMTRKKKKKTHLLYVY